MQMEENKIEAIDILDRIIIGRVDLISMHLRQIQYQII